jgi:O-antigen/teichoic acid export membrane protein
MLIKFSAFQLIGKFVPGLIGLASAAVLTRILPPDEFGIYGLVVAIAQMTVLAAFSWLGVTVMRLASGHPDDPLFRTSALAVFASVAAVIAAVAGGFALSPVAGSYAGVIAAALFATLVLAYFDLRGAFYAAACNFAPPMRFNIARAFAAAGAAIAAAQWWGGGLAASVAASTAAFLVLLATGRIEHLRRLKLSHESIRKIVAFGGPLVAGFALVAVATLSDRLVLDFFGGKSAVGLYAAGAVLVSSTLQLGGNAVGSAGFPLVVRAYDHGGPGSADAQLRLNAVALLGFLLPGGAGLSILAPNIAEVLVGPWYREALVELMPLLAGAAVIFAIRANWVDHCFHLAGATRKLAEMAGVMALVSLAALIGLVPRYGHLGAGAASLVTAAAGLGYAVHLSRRVYTLPFPWKDAGKVALAVAFMAAALFWLRDLRGLPALLGQISFGGLVYLGAVFVLNPVDVRSKAAAMLRAWGGIVHARSSRRNPSLLARPHGRSAAFPRCRRSLRLWRSVVPSRPGSGRTG